MYRVDVGERAVVYCGDSIEVLKSLPSESVNCCVTSPPYYGLRDYGVPGQIGLEESPEQYIDRLVDVFREVRRVLRDDGTLWVNIGDSYNSVGGTVGGLKYSENDGKRQRQTDRKHLLPNLKYKDLIGIPWMLAFALRTDGWYLRSEIIWHKPNVMPESVKDRPTKAHEQIFLLSKSQKYFYDADAIREPHNEKYIQHRSADSYKGTKSEANPRSDRSHAFVKRYSGTVVGNPLGRNKRSVWNIVTKAFKGAHFAVFPYELPETCLLAGSALDGIVLDPFSGAATTGIVALQRGRQYIGIELNPEYVELSKARFQTAFPPPEPTASLDDLFEDKCS